jgi:SNF2 family DNA or RNA helicase
MFKTKPYAHQQSEYDRTRSFPSWCLFWEMGCGKSWYAINKAAHLVREGKVTAVLVICPPGLPENWTLDEVPSHWPDDVPVRAFAYKTKKAGTVAHRRGLQECLAAPETAFLAMSYHSFMTAAGRKAADALVKRPTFIVIDESQRIKSAKAKRTRSVVTFGRRSEWKLALSGTPVTKNPFDIYPQVKFVDEDFWKRKGFADYLSFKTYFGVFEQRVNGASGQRFEQVVGFRHLDELCGHVQEVSSRVLKDDVLDLPPKVYSKRYFDLSPAQEAMYHELKQNLLVRLEGGETLTAPVAVVLLMRLQQIACGYHPVDGAEEGAPLVRFPENPRLAALKEALEDVEGKAIIFARFRADVDQITELLGPAAVRYDGAVDEDGRLAARRRFRDDPDCVYFVGNPAVAGTGLTLTSASTTVYYSLSFDLEQRLQSEDRAHRIGQTNTVTIIDLIARGTVDNHIVGSLRAKKDLASAVTGDALKEWL